jgi:hypothetical protein
VRTPHERRTAGAARRRGGSARGDDGREERVQLLEPLVERDQLVTALDQKRITEKVAAEHLQHQAAEITEALLPHTQKRSPLTAELARVGQRPARRAGRDSARHGPFTGAAEACEQRRPRHAENLTAGCDGYGAREARC